jgi:hypothetical protein
MIAALLTLLLFARAGSDEFTDQLARLGAPRSAERAAAERWLQAHLVFERYPELAAAALAGDAEVRGRLVRVLSGDPRHLALALALGAEKDAVLGALGREAVRAAVVQADPRLGETAQREGLEELLRRAASESSPRSLRLDPRLTLAQMVEGLELVGELPLGVTLDPRLATRTIRREEELPSAPWNVLLVQLARALGVEIEIHGLARGRDNALGPFLRLTVEPGPARTGVDLVSEWLFELAKDGDESVRARAACNLASSGFAPALEWMDHLVRARGDRAALEGLALAAARGRVAPVLSSPAVLEPLLAEAETQAGARSARILCALAHGGCFDAAGNSLATRLLAGFESATPRGRWLRFFVLERNGCAAPEIAVLAQRLLADPSTAPALRLQALFTLAGQGEAPPSGPPAVERLPELFRCGLDEMQTQRLGRVLRLLSLAPPFTDPARIPPDWTERERLALLQAWLWRGEPAPPSAHVAAWMEVPPAQSAARGELLADELLPWRARGAAPQLDGILVRARDLASARAGAPAQASGPTLENGIQRVRLLLGLVPAAEVPIVLARGGFELQGQRSDLALLGALAGYPVSIAKETDARAVLQARLASALGENRRLQEHIPLLHALERAAAGLYSAGRDEEGDTFCSRVQSDCSRSKSELGRWIERQPWPPAPLAETRDVARTLAGFEVPSSL